MTTNRTQCTYCGADDFEGHRPDCIFKRGNDFCDRNKIEVDGALRDLKKWNPQPIDIPNRITDKPLKWRTGPVPEGHEDAQFLIEAKEGYILAKGYAVLKREYWLPLSDILALVEE